MILNWFLAGALLFHAGAEPGKKKRTTRMDDSRFTILRDSRNPRQLVATALELAQSADAATHRSLASWLASGEFLSRLDSEDAYNVRQRNQLGIARVLRALASNPSQTAREVLVGLTEMGGFLSEGVRRDLLIQSLAEVRPAPPKAIAFWDAHSRTEDGYTPLTIEALVKNGSAPAMELLERKLADPTHPYEAKLVWMRMYMLPQRNDLELLLACERMLMGSLPPVLRPALVETLFDYRPDEWYSEHGGKTPPNRLFASAEAKDVMRRLAYIAIQSVPLDPAVRAKVELAMREIGGPPQQQ